MKINPLKFTFIVLRIMLFAGVFFLAVSVWDVYKGFSSRSWLATNAVVTAIEERVDTMGRGIGRYWHVEYTYEANGSRFEASKLTFSGFLPPDIKSSVKNWKVGQKIEIFFNPKDPHDAVLRQGITIHQYVIAPTCALVITIIFYVSRKIKGTPSIQEIRRGFS